MPTTAELRFLLQFPVERGTAIARALGPLTGEVKIKRARAAYDKFEMVEDYEQGP
jgi:hypothetical protein